ncbi:MAG: DMT family transporter [Coriobacteriia bacterium]|nr:DMT family transporter [Coriobacteriia bacterium]
MKEQPKHPAVRSYILLLVTLVFWGSAFAVVRYGLVSPENPSGYHPGSLALLRFLVAAVVALGYLIITKKGLPLKKDLPRIICAGFIGIALYHTLFNYGEQMVASGASAVLIGFAPVFVVILSTIFLKEHLSLWGWLGVICSLVGVIIVGMSSVEGFHIDIHALALLGSALSTAVLMVLSKSLLSRYSGTQLTSYTIIVGVIPLFMFFPELLRDISSTTWQATSAIAYLGVFPGFLAYATWNVALSRLSAGRLSVFMNIVPFIAALFAWAWLGEIPGTLVILGGIVAIAGVLMVQLLGRRREG